MRIQTVQIHGDVTVNSLTYRMTKIYPEIRPQMRDPAVIISQTTPLSNSIKDNVVSARHVTSCVRDKTDLSVLLLCILGVTYMGLGPETSFPDFVVFPNP
jgi:hypothetical protein